MRVGQYGPFASQVRLAPLTSLPEVDLTPLYVNAKFLAKATMLMRVSHAIKPK